MTNREPKSRIPTDGASRQGGGVSLGDLLRARGLVPQDPVAPPLPAGDAPDRGSGTSDPARAIGMPAFPGKVVVRLERKGRGGRTVTRVQGLGWPDEALADLARTMARALGCGAGTEDGDVVLHGDQRDRAESWLVARGARRVVR